MKRATIILTMTALLIALLPSCNKTESGKEKGLANVNIVFNVDGLQTKDTAPIGTNEGIKTLRILILDWNDDGTFNIIRNEKRSYESEITDSKVLRIYDIPVGVHSFYFIANEESLGMEYTNEVINNNLKPTDIGGVSKNKLLFSDDNNQLFPTDQSKIATYGLPLNGYMMNVNVTKDMEPIHVQMVHNVVKVVMTISNSTTTDLTISEMIWGKFFSNSIYLFGEGNIDVPTDTKYSEANFATSISLPGRGGTVQYTFYMYPSEAGPNIFTLGFNTAQDINFEPQTLINTSLPMPQPLAAVSRNTQLNINASIATLTKINISFKVTDWNKAEILVPPFN